MQKDFLFTTILEQIFTTSTKQRFFNFWTSYHVYNAHFNKLIAKVHNTTLVCSQITMGMRPRVYNIIINNVIKFDIDIAKYVECWDAMH